MHRPIEHASPSANDNGSPTLGDVVAARFGRRDLVKGMLAATALAVLVPPALRAAIADARAAEATGFTFKEITHGVDETHHVPEGYDADILIRWGDPVTADAPAFNPKRQTAAAQAKQFGYNNDFIGYIPLPIGSDSSNHALLCINQEYTNAEVMFPDMAAGKVVDVITKDQVDIEMAAHGATVLEIQKQNGKWQVVKGSRYNRRITAETPMKISGPAAGHERLKTSADAAGANVRGMVNNCAGGNTPWGTYLTCEENFSNYFWGDVNGHNEEDNYKSYGIPGKEYGWGRFHGRFDITKEPNEANRFGWVVEIDATDPSSTPVKRTALGRFKHEGAETIVNKDGRLVIYSGDDQAMQFLYKFVTARRVDTVNRAANRDLLDSGTLFVAKFAADGSVEWLPLVHGAGPLTAANGFNSQADVLIESRKAAKLAGATPMDRPEDVEASKVSNKVYVVLTNNTGRTAEQVDAANPRAKNEWGQILEIAPAGDDHAATKGSWTIFVKGGSPDPEVGGTYGSGTSANGWFACPDNVACDNQGRLWVATDQGTAWAKASGTADGVWAVETSGPGRGTSRMFFRVPVGAEMCGPRFSPDNRTFFCAVQHPGVDGVESYKPFGRKSTFADPATRWPDFKPDMPVRPAVVVITKKDGGVIGS
jgi:secreted PhoX family phosphatase